MAYCSLEIVRSACHRGGVALFSWNPAWASHLPRLRREDFLIEEF